MNPYEQEMYDFLTEEENLKGLIIAKDQYKKVREGLIKSFWNKVHNNLSSYFKDSTRWEVKIDRNIFDQYSKLYLYDKSLVIKLNEHPLVFFCWERLASSFPYYGICTNKDISEIDKRKVFDIISQEKSAFKNELSSFEKSDKWPLWAGDRQFDFNNDQTLLQIIPLKQEELAQQFANQLINLFELLQNSYERILHECESIK